MRGNTQRHGSKKITVDASTGQMMTFLYACRYRMLEAITVDELVARYRVKPKVAQYERQIALQKRAGEA